MPSHSAKITIHEVAAAAGVSIKTVSRVIREEPQVSSETRRLVREAIDRLHYVPHASASALSSTVAQTIGLLFLRITKDTTARSGFEYYMGMQFGALNACEALGYGLRVVRLQQQGESLAHELIRRVHLREIGGYIIPTPGCDEPGLLDALDKASVRYSTMSPRAARDSSPSVSTDDRAAMRTVVQQVLALGHRRIGFIRGFNGWRDTEERYAGYLDAMTSAGIGIDNRLIEQGEFSFDAGVECAARLLGLADPPTAIVASSDNAAAGVLAYAHSLQMKIPQQLSVTGYDDFELARKLWPSLTTVHQPIEKMAEVATRQVIALLQPLRNGMVAPPKHVLMHGEVVLRDSLTAPASDQSLDARAPKQRVLKPADRRRAS